MYIPINWYFASYVIHSMCAYMYILLVGILLHMILAWHKHTCVSHWLLSAPHVTPSIYAWMYILFMGLTSCVTHSRYTYMSTYKLAFCFTRHSLDICLYIYLTDWYLHHTPLTWYTQIYISYWLASASYATHSICASIYILSTGI